MVEVGSGGRRGEGLVSRPELLARLHDPVAWRVLYVDTPKLHVLRPTSSPPPPPRPPMPSSVLQVPPAATTTAAPVSMRPSSRAQVGCSEVHG